MRVHVAITVVLMFQLCVVLLLLAVLASLTAVCSFLLSAPPPNSQLGLACATAPAGFVDDVTVVSSPHIISPFRCYFELLSHIHRSLRMYESVIPDQSAESLPGGRLRDF